MSTRIIIEKDGERWVGKVVDSDYIKIQKDRSGWFCNLNLSLALDELPPVIRTDNSEVIANLEAENAKLTDDIVAASGKCYKLEAENAKLREALKDVLVVAKNRIPTIPTFFECEAICKVNDIMKGEKK